MLPDLLKAISEMKREKAQRHRGRKAIRLCEMFRKGL
jgi:hypothetical protein